MEAGIPSVEILGEHSLLVRSLAPTASQRRAEIRRWSGLLRARPLPGQCDLVPTAEALAVHWLPPLPGGPGLTTERQAERLASRIQISDTTSEPPSAFREIPAVFGGDDGPDLEDVARHTGMPSADVVRLFCSVEYEVTTVGFSPGFPYLRGLPPVLETPRRARPRSRVAAGSIGIGGAQAGIYPQATPGGWNLLGRTTLSLFDPSNEDNPALLRPGDRVRFRPVEQLPVTTVPARGKDVWTPALTLRGRGTLATVQDLGRTGLREVGVTASGALDPDALRCLNWLIGNPANAAGLEFLGSAPDLQFHRHLWICLAGDAPAEIRPWKPRLVRAGAVLKLGPLPRGGLLTLAVGGGLDLPVRRGSRSQQKAVDWVSALPYPLTDQTDLPVAGGDSKPSSSSSVSLIDASLGRTAEPAALRLVAGPHWPLLTREAQHALATGAFRVSRDRDRMGVRLDGPPLSTTSAVSLLSEPIAPGVLQLPPDGRLIALLAEAQTVGGYPKVARVIEADRWRLAAAVPGQELRFVLVSDREAREAEKKRVTCLQGLHQALREHAQIPQRNIDLNVDAGESSPHEAALFALATSCNLACGGHTGDETTQRRSLQAARRASLLVGAHPSYEDRENFGRRETGASPEAIRELVHRQVGRLAMLANEEGVVLTHVKPHGALYHRVAHDPAATEAFLGALESWREEYALFLPAGCGGAARARSRGFVVVSEGFIDRGYRADGTLIPRGETGDVLTDARAAAAQALRLAMAGISRPLGSSVRVRTLCTHGDGPHALDALRASREVLHSAGLAAAGYLS